MSEAQAGSKSDSAAGGGDAKGDSKAGGSEWLKNLPALIAAIAALVTSVAALRKPPDTTAAKASYEELSKLVSKLEDSSDQNHQDIIALRNFLEGYLRANGKLVAEATPVPVPQDPGKPTKPAKGDSGSSKAGGERHKPEAGAATGTSAPQAKPVEPPPPGLAGEKPAPGETAAAAAPMLRDPESGAYLIPKIRRRAPLPAPRGFQQIVKELKEQDGAGKDGADKAPPAPGAKDEPAKDK